MEIMREMQGARAPGTRISVLAEHLCYPFFAAKKKRGLIISYFVWQRG